GIAIGPRLRRREGIRVEPRNAIACIMRAGSTAGIKRSACYPVSPSHPPTNLGSGVLQIYVKCLAAMICGDPRQAPAAQHAIRNGVGVAEPPSSAANGQFVDVVGQESVAIIEGSRCRTRP